MLSTWSIFKTGSPSIGILTPVTDPSPLSPILGTGSLHVHQYSVDDSLINMSNTGYTRGLTHGRFRSIFRLTYAAGMTQYSAGFVFMQSGLNLTAGGGNGYFAHLTVEANGTNALFAVRKFVTTGLQPGLLSTTTLYEGTTLGTVLNKDVCFEVEWNTEGDVECVITLRHAIDTTDFELLTLETTVVDTTSPFLTTVGEGLAFTNGTSSGETDWLIDSTNLLKFI